MLYPSTRFWVSMNRQSGASHRTLAQDEREAWERRLASMADAGLDPRDEEQPFRAELNQYLAYTYLRFKGGSA